MGRTIPSFRIALEQEIELWQQFRKALRLKDRTIFDNLMDKARIHGDAGMLASRPVILDTIFMAIILEQQKEIESIHKKIDLLKRMSMEK